MTIGNGAVAAILRSPAHRLLSGSTALVRYTGTRSGRTITTPTQYVEHDDGVVVLAARPSTKTWWRNFTRPHDVDLLVRRSWRPCTGKVVEAAERPELVEAYRRRFPRAAKATEGAVVVWCEPRPTSPDRG